MADTAALTPGSQPSPMQTAQSILAGQQGREKELKGDIAEASSKLATNADRETKQLETLEGEAGRLTPPKLETPPPPVAKTSDPVQVWGSMAMILAGVGSLMTRTPLTTAMNAAAAVINGYGAKDQAAFDQAFKTWEMASKNAVELANFQQKAYDDALGSIERRERMTIEERQAADRATEAELRGLFTAFGDITAKDRLETSGLLGVQKHIDQVKEWNQKFESMIPNVIVAAQYHKAALQVEADPRFQQLNDMDKLSVLIGMMPQSMKPLSQEQQTQAENHIRDKLEASPLYKSWAAAQVSSAEISNTLQQVRSGSISATVAADQFTQTFNGGRAIRGFQMQMLTQHASLWDQAQILAKHVQNGGGLSDNQLQTMAQAAALAADYLNQQVAYMAMSAQADAVKQHLDPQTVIPPELVSFANQNPQAFKGLSVPKVDTGGGQDAGGISPKSIEYLKAHPDPKTKAHFDERYGAGAAEKILGQ